MVLQLQLLQPYGDGVRGVYGRRRYRSPGANDYRMRLLGADVIPVKQGRQL